MSVQHREAPPNQRTNHDSPIAASPRATVNNCSTTTSSDSRFSAYTHLDS